MYINSNAEINVPDGVTEIGEGAFGGCMPNRVTLPASVKNIGKNAFSGAGYKLDPSMVANKEFVFVYEGTKTQWTAIAKDKDWYGDGNRALKTVYCAKEDGGDGYDTVIIQR